MKNILGKEENLELYNKEGKLVYEYYVYSNGNSVEKTYDSKGNILTYKNSKGFSYEYTRDSFGNELTYENSKGYSSKYTRDSVGKELTFEDSNDVRRGFDIPEYTMEELVEILKEKLGNFKIKK